MRAGSVSNGSCGPRNNAQWLRFYHRFLEPRVKIPGAEPIALRFPMGQLLNVTKQGVGVDLDLSMRCDDDLVVSAG
eukprot:8601008-Pyramimonas_sp.AAC.1